MSSVHVFNRYFSQRKFMTASFHPARFYSRVLVDTIEAPQSFLPRDFKTSDVLRTSISLIREVWQQSLHIARTVSVKFAWVSNSLLSDRVMRRYWTPLVSETPSCSRFNYSGFAFCFRTTWTILGLYWGDLRRAYFANWWSGLQLVFMNTKKPIRLPYFCILAYKYCMKRV